MILNKRHSNEEVFLRKITVLVRCSGDENIRKAEDVSKYINTLYKDLPFEEKRDILLAWQKIQNDPYHTISFLFAEEMVEFFIKVE